MATFTPATITWSRTTCSAISAKRRWQSSASPRQRKFGRDKFDTLPRHCRECEVLFACYGECPRNRFAEAPDGEAGLNYLCAGYRKFFNHIDGPMRSMAGLLKSGRFADEIMTIEAGVPA